MLENQNITLENQELIRSALRIINETTTANLQNTFINKENINSIHNETLTLMKTLQLLNNKTFQ